VGNKLDSQSEGCRFESRHIQILDRNEVKTLPGSIFLKTILVVSLKKKRSGSQMGHAKKEDSFNFFFTGGNPILYKKLILKKVEISLKFLDGALL